MQRTNEREHNYHILKYEKSHINRLQVTFFHSDDRTFEYDLYSFGKKKNEKKKYRFQSRLGRKHECSNYSFYSDSQITATSPEVFSINSRVENFL